MTRRECEDKIIELAEQIRSVWKEYNPSGEYLSVMIWKDAITANDCHCINNDRIVMGERTPFRPIHVLKQSDGFIKSGVKPLALATWI